MNYTHTISEALKAARDKLAELAVKVPDMSELERRQIRDVLGAFDNVDRKIAPIDAIFAKYQNADRDSPADASTARHTEASSLVAKPLDPEVDFYHRVLARATPASARFVECLLGELGDQRKTGRVEVARMRELLGTDALSRMTHSLNIALKKELRADEAAGYETPTNGNRHLVNSHALGRGDKVTHYSLIEGAYDPLSDALNIYKSQKPAN